MKHTSDLHRLLKLILLIQAKPGLKAGELAEECEVAPRTIFRDLKKLEACKVPVEQVPGTRGYRISREFFLPAMHLSVEEAMALTILRDQVAAKQRDGLLSPALRALMKVQAGLPAPMREAAAAAEGKVAIKPAPVVPGESYVDVYNKIQSAILRGRVLLCQYESSRPRGGGIEHADGEEFDFEPYGLFFAGRAWYVVGRHSARKGLRSLKLSRFSRVTETARPFTIPASFSIDKHLGNAWTMIRGDTDHQVDLLFDAAFGKNIAETLWHKTQEIVEHDDGRVTLRVTVSGLDEIVWWILSMGPHCRVIGPPELASKVAELARATARQYDR